MKKMLRKTKKPYFIALVLFFSVFMNTNLKAQISKYQALYIYNICRYVEWPTDFNSSQFVIGIVGKNAELKTSLTKILHNKKIQNKKVIIKVITTPSQSAGCNIVFFSKGKEIQINTFVSSSTNSLFFSESVKAINKGSDINFFIDGSKLKFDLNNTNLSKKQLKLSMELKQLATNII